MGPEWRKEEVLYHQAKQSRWRSLSHWGGGKAWAFRCHPPVGSLRAILCVIVATIFGNPYRFFWPICASITIDNLNSQTLTTMAAPGDVEKPQAASVQCPDTTIAAHRTATEDYRAASLSNARKVVLEDIGHFVIAPDSYLWDLYPVPHNFEAIMQYLTEEGWLTSDRDWDPKRISRADIEQRKVGFIEQEVFEPLAKIFNAVLSYKPSNSKVLGMVNAGSHPLKSDRISTNRPDAYLAPQSLQANPSAKGPKVPKRRLWRDATCPFEYKFGDGDKDDVSRSPTPLVMPLNLGVNK